MRPNITTVVTEEAGYTSAITGIAHSYKLDSFQRAEEVARTLAPKDGGHNKFLESMIIWVTVKAPRFWWQEADTYRLSTKQSESTMHTLVGELKAHKSMEEVALWVQDSFEYPEMLCEEQLRQMWELAQADHLKRLKALLPEGFLQMRTWCMSYKTMRNIILQRRSHRLPHWPKFIKDILEQVQYPELLPKLEVPDGS